MSSRRRARDRTAVSGVDYLPPQGDPQFVPEPPPSVADELLLQPASDRSRRLGRRSLTARLVTSVLILVVLLVGAISATTYYALRSFLFNRLDQQLSATADQNVNYIERCIAHQTTASMACPNNGAPSPQKEWVAILGPQGEVIGAVSGGNFVTLNLSSTLRRQFASGSTTEKTLTVNGAQLRATQRTTPEGIVIVTGLSTEDVSKTLGRLVLIEVLIGAGAVIFAVAATGWGVQRSLRNLYQVTGTAQEVAAELGPTGAGLDRRVPVVEEGTEVGQLAESMNTLLSAVETQFTARLESEQRMRQFLADASHELRTPLTSIRGYAELARMQRAAGDTQQDNLDRIESEGTRMSRLVDDLLLLARGDADGQAQIAAREPVDVADLLDDAVQGSLAAFPDRPIDFDAEPVPMVLGDRDQLLRVVRNLITNAAVHTESGRPIRVRGRAQADGVAITIADGGPGLPPEQAAHVFERFWRADKARTRARGGTGLGLSIVAAVVQAHGGSVRFDSTVESGSVVTVWLPPAS
jgi:two-component system OmpR family sensor kinase